LDRQNRRAGVAGLFYFKLRGQERDTSNSKQEGSIFSWHAEVGDREMRGTAANASRTSRWRDCKATKTQGEQTFPNIL
jgi:hypothetical protein